MSVTYEKADEGHAKLMNSSYQDQQRMKNLNYQMGHILYQIFKIIFNALSRNMKRLLLIGHMESNQQN